MRRAPCSMLHASHATAIPVYSNRSTPAAMRLSYLGLRSCALRVRVRATRQKTMVCHAHPELLELDVVPELEVEAAHHLRGLGRADVPRLVVVHRAERGRPPRTAGAACGAARRRRHSACADVRGGRRSPGSSASLVELMERNSRLASCPISCGSDASGLPAQQQRAQAVECAQLRRHATSRLPPTWRAPRAQPVSAPAAAAQ